MLMATDFESDFSGLRGFSSCGHYLSWCVQQLVHSCRWSTNIPFRLCDYRI